ncbi:MAG: aminodeoxychorismate/anthranilate synthase component II [Flavobacterium sp. BFFFF2]|nr:MAG: aminodeoxychorismate/anthranilate synthase component II [Flavobacterium sp. BFFFF2]
MTKQKRLLLIDNKDSFTYNLVHYLEGLGAYVDVERHDLTDLDLPADYDAIVLSPGPGLPEESANLMPLVHQWKYQKPILGICLGHQALAQAFGATLYNLPQVLHGQATELFVTAPDAVIYKDIPAPVLVGRYHSWAVSTDHFPEELEITATDSNGIILSFMHRQLPITGMQFHPESVLSPHGRLMLGSWLASIHFSQE